MNKFGWLLITIIFCSSFGLFAQEIVENNPVRIGDKRIKTSRIQAGTDKFILFRVSNGIKQPLFFLTRTITIENKNNQEVLVVEQTYDSANGRNTDTSVLLRHSLAPLAYFAKLSNQTESFEFTSTNVIGKITGKEGKVENIETPLPEPVFNAVVLEDLIQAVSLNQNSRLSFRLYNPGKQFFTNTLQFIGAEKIKTVEGKILETWAISLEGLPVPTKIWIAKSNQKLIQQKSELPNGDEFWKVRLYL